MTTTNRIRLYAAALAVLVVLFVIGLAFGPRRARPLGAVYPGLELSDVTAMEISSDTISVMLRRDGAAWVLDEGDSTYPARTDRIESFLTEAIESSLVRRITGNESLWSDFGLTAVGGSTVTIHSSPSRPDDSVVSAVWGASAAEPGQSYVRRPDSPDVYSSDGELGFYVGQPVTYWSYLRVLPEDVKTDGVVRLATNAAMELPDGGPMDSYLLRRGQGEASGNGGEAGEVWHADGMDDPLDGPAVERVLREIVDLVGSDFRRDGQATAAAASAGTIGISLGDGREYTLAIVQIGDEFACRASGPGLPGAPFGGLAYTLSESTVRRLFPALDSLAIE